MMIWTLLHWVDYWRRWNFDRPGYNQA